MRDEGRGEWREKATGPQPVSATVSQALDDSTQWQWQRNDSVTHRPLLCEVSLNGPNFALSSHATSQISASTFDDFAAAIVCIVCVWCSLVAQWWVAVGSI